MTREGPVNTRTCGPAPAVLQSPEIEGQAGECAADLVFVAGHRRAGLGVKQDVIDGKADATGHAGKELGFRIHNRGLAGIAEWESDSLVVPQGCAGGIALNTDNDRGGSKLIIAAALAADNRTARRRAYRGYANCRAKTVEGILHELHRICDVFLRKPGPDMDADIAARPVEGRRDRCRSFNGQIGRR